MIGMSVDRPHDSSEVHKVMQSYSYPAAMSEDAKVNEFGSPDTVPPHLWSIARALCAPSSPQTKPRLPIKSSPRRCSPCWLREPQPEFHSMATTALRRLVLDRKKRDEASV